MIYFVFLKFSLPKRFCFLNEKLVSQVCVVSASLVQLSFVNDNPGLTRNLHNALCFFNPLYPLMGCLNCITKVGFKPERPVSSFTGFSVCPRVFDPVTMITATRGPHLSVNLIMDHRDVGGIVDLNRHLVPFSLFQLTVCLSEEFFNKC